MFAMNEQQEEKIPHEKIEGTKIVKYPPVKISYLTKLATEGSGAVPVPERIRLKLDGKICGICGCLIPTQIRKRQTKLELDLPLYCTQFIEKMRLYL